MLTAYRVLDLTGDRGLIAGMILADLGADVIAVEPPDGNPARPVLDSRPRGAVRRKTFTRKPRVGWGHDRHRSTLWGTNIVSDAKASEPTSLNVLSGPRLSGAGRTS